MLDQEATLNTDSDSSPDETLNTGAPSAARVIEDGIFSTTDFDRAPDVEPNAKGSEAEDQQTLGPQPSGEEATKGPIPYARFKEKVDQIKASEERIKKLEEEISARQVLKEKEQPAKEGDSKSSAPFKYEPMHVKTDDEIQDWFEKNPKGFIGNLAAQILDETTRYIADQQLKQSKIGSYQSKLKEFGEKNEGFDSLMTSGKLDEFAEENPGHDVFSAYYELTSEQRQKSVQDQIDDAVSKATEKIKQEYEKNIKAKRSLRTIGPGPASAPAPDKELQNTSSTGGLTSVIASRLERMRAMAR